MIPLDANDWDQEPKSEKPEKPENEGFKTKKACARRGFGASNPSFSFLFSRDFESFQVRLRDSGEVAAEIPQGLGHEGPRLNLAPCF